MNAKSKENVVVLYFSYATFDFSQSDQKVYTVDLGHKR